MKGENYRLAGAYEVTIPRLDPETRHAARLTVAENAKDADDARLLLDALGIGGDE